MSLRQLLYLALALVIGLSLVTGCAAGGPATPAPTTAPTPKPVEPTKAAATAGPATPAATSPAAGVRDHILIGVPYPATGPLAAFGQTTPWVDERAAAAINKDGGILIKDLNKKLPLKFKVVDTESNPTKAAEVASKLILEDKVDLVLTFGTPDTVNPVSATCERHKVPCIATNAPVEPWLTGGPYEWSFLAFFTVDQLSDMFVGVFDLVGDKTNKKVGVLFPNDPDGMTWAKTFAEQMPKKGYTVIDPGRWPYGTKDFTAIINRFKQDNCDILSGTLLAPDFATFWRQAKQQGYSPKLATIGKAVIFPGDVTALGDMGEGITTEAWWTCEYTYKSSINGETAPELCKAWSERSGKQPDGTLGPRIAIYEIAADALKRAGSLDKAKIRDAIQQTDLVTMIGRIKYDDKHVSPIPCVGTQWVKGKTFKFEQVIVWNEKYPDLPKKTADILFPLPR